ncbi:Fibronectin type III [Candidatus Nanopelagicaceae bacterium]
MGSRMSVSSSRNFVSQIRQRSPILLRKVLVLTLALGFWQSVTPSENASAVATATAANGTTITNTYTYTGAIENFTIPANVTSITMTVTGAGAGGAGGDGSDPPPLETTLGVVTGSVSVTPGQVISIGVGAPGATGASYQGGGSKLDAAKAIDYFASEFNVLGGTNPFGGYGGGWGGAVGPQGSSGGGGGGGAASVVKIGTLVSPSAVATIVAGGGGGSGGSGNGQPGSIYKSQICTYPFSNCLQGGVGQKSFAPITGAYPSNFSPLFPNGDTTNGQNGWNAYGRWWLDTPNTSGSYDGGGGGAGGGGARGGARGTSEYGRNGTVEWFGATGGSPGENSTSGLGGLTASYSTISGQVRTAGSVVISYETGSPTAPLTPNGTPGNAMVRVYWGVPTSPGLSAITSYSVQYSVSPYSSWTTATDAASTTSYEVTGLTNSTAYTFRVKANSAIGSSAWALTPVLTPYIFSTAPTITSITPGDANLSVAFNAGISSFAINSYQYSVDTGTTWILADQSATPVVIRGLTNGRTYGVQLRAITAAGIGTASATSQGTPSTVPGAGVILSATTTGITSYTNGNTGGLPITGYDITYNPGVGTCPGVTAATNAAAPTGVYSAQPAGTAWAYKARNANGAGPWSNCVVSSNSPTIPTSVVETLTAQNSAIQVGWSANINNGPISKIEYRLDGGAYTDAGTIANPFIIGGLTNGTLYEVIIRVTNSAGTSSPTSASATPRTVPSSPIDPLAVGAPGAANVFWTASTNNGGAAISGYTATAYTALVGGSVAGTACTTASLTCQITGLGASTTYYYSVVATNAAGNSVATSPRVLVQPAALPGAPTITSITGANATLSVAFTAGTFDANAPLVYYKYSIDNGTNWVSLPAGTTSPFTISSLTNGTTYNVKLRAVASNGDGATSAAVAGAPKGRPDAVDPSTITYVASSGSVAISWTAPNNNGAQITNYTLTAFNNISTGSALTTCSVNGTPATSTCTILLANGTPAYVSIETSNSMGTSTRSSPRVLVRAGIATTTALTISPLTQSTLGKTETLTATVTSSSATGTFNFTSGGTSITGCSAVVIASGVARCATSSLSAGVNVLSAYYSGDASYASSSAANQNYTINGAVTETATVTTLNVVNGFVGVDTITASGGTGNKTLTLSVSPSSAGITINTATLNTAILNVANNVTPGTYTATITATDSVTATASISVTINVTRSADSSLKTLSFQVPISPTFAPGTLSYTATATNDRAYVNVAASWEGYGETATATFGGSDGGTYLIPTLAGVLSAKFIYLSVGANVVTVKTYAQDGTSTIYTITITKAGSSVSALTGLTFSNSVALDTSFAGGTTTYASTVPNTTTSTQVTGTWTGTGETATATFGGNTYALTSGTILATAIPLTAGAANVVTITGYAQNGTATTYTVTITRTAAETASALSALAFTNSSITLAPTFAAATTTYAMTVPYATSSTQVTGTWTGSFETATATFNGSTYALTSGTILSTAMTLSVGANRLLIKGYAQDGSLTTYTITITRTALAAVSALTGLSFTNSNITLAPTFDSATVTYAMTVPYTTTSTRVTGTWTGTGETATATFGGNTYALTSGTILATAIPLTAGAANVVTITGYAQNGTATTYTVTITRTAAETASALSALAFTNSSITLAPTFAAATTTYAMTVPYATSSTQVTGTWTGSFETATATFNGSTYALTSGTILSTAMTLSVGANTLLIKGYAQDGSLTTYTVTITRTAIETVSTISALTLTNASITIPSFASATTSYSITVSEATTSTQVTGTWTGSFETATATFGGSTYALTSGSILTNAMVLSIGSNTLVIKGYAQNGSTTTYTLTITRQTITLTTPTAPTLTAVSESTTAISVSYSASQVSNTSVYSIALFSSSNSLISTVQQSYSSGVLVFSGLTANTGYYAKVTAIGSGNYGNSAASAASTTVSTNALPVTPTITTQPGSVSITSGNTTSFNVVTSRSDAGSLSYQWQVAASATPNVFASVIGGSASSSNTGSTYTTPALTVANSGDRYRVLVYNSTNGAITASAVTSDSATATVGAIKLTQPSAPSGSAVEGSATSATITYTSVSNASIYRIVIYRSSDNYLAYDANNTYSTGAVVVTGLAAGTTYYAKVTANASGNYSASDASNASASFTTKSVLATPTLSGSATSGTLKSIGLSWGSATANATSYSIRIYDSSGASLLESITVSSAATISQSVTTSQYASIADGTSYQFAIVAFGVGNYLNSAESEKIGVTTNSSAGSISIATQPQAASKTALQTADFSVSASGDGNLTYQWQTSSDTGITWTNVSAGTGATTSSYTTASLNRNSNGHRFRVVITNTKNGSTSTAYSDDVLLSVAFANQAPLVISTLEGRTEVALTLRASGGTTAETIVYSTITEGCTISGAVLTRTTVGSCVIQAIRPGNATVYNDVLSLTSSIRFLLGDGNVDVFFAGDATEFVYQSNVRITVNVVESGKVQFMQDGRPIAGCMTIKASPSTPAVCNWKPSSFGYPRITAILTPTNTANPARSSAIFAVRVNPR